MTIAEIMRTDVVSVGMDDTLEAMQQLFDRHRFHHLMVAAGGRLIGVVSDRDVLRRVSPFVGTIAAQLRDDATLRVKAHQLMTRRPITVTPQTDVTAAAAVMVDQRISCLPVVDEQEKLVGVVTWKDLLRAVVLARGATAVTPRA